MEASLPLHLCHVRKSLLIVSRFYTFLHGSALMALIYYRASSLFQMTSNGRGISVSLLLVFASELILSFIWLISQAYRWRPISRTIFPERLPEDDKLPAIDVFICTADPNKEPSFKVMNTVISAMALDYPPEKLNVYLSDDAGSPVTVEALKEAWRFARSWLPFCRKYGVNTRCPEAYFSRGDVFDEKFSRRNIEFNSDKEKIEKQYEVFKERVEGIKQNTSSASSVDHPASIEVITGGDGDPLDAGKTMPLTVYVSREKRPSHPHNFKAGAVNALLRVSGAMSNSPYILVLDCDMYCNDASSARQAMCFHLDPKKPPKLGWVQFPQKFHNVCEKDIYDSQARNGFLLYWPGTDGLGGPTVSGTGFFITREALVGSGNIGMTYRAQNGKKLSPALLQEIQLLASCAFENNTQWGKEGYVSVFWNPPKPAFLGSATTNLSDLLLQGTRWFSGLIGVGISKYSPLIYGPPRMSFLLSMCYAEIALFPFFCLPLWCLGIVPQLCLIRGVSLYPEISSPFFWVFVFIFISSNLKHIQEIIFTGHPIRSWIYEQRMWMIKSVTIYTYGTVNAILEKIGMKEANFSPTNKVPNEGRLKLYQEGIYDFHIPTLVTIPICTLMILNLCSLLLGGVAIFRNRNFGEMFVQAFIALFVLVVQYPVIEGMFFRKDNGRVPQSAVLLSAALALAILSIGTVV